MAFTMIRLIGGTERKVEAGQRRLDKPRLEGHPCSLAVGIELLGHSQRFERRCDAPGRYDYAYDDADSRLVAALPLPSTYFSWIVSRDSRYG